MPSPSRSRTGKKKVLIADRESIFRVGLKRVFSGEDDLLVVAQAETAAQTLAMVKLFNPDLLVVQQEIAAEERRELISAVQRMRPGCKIMMTASSGAENGYKRFMVQGARVILKSASPEAFIKCARNLVGSKSSRPGKHLADGASGPAKTGSNGHRRPVDTLTRREKTIVSCLTHGLRNREIATQLEISEQTVKNHLRSIYDKVGVSDRLELVLYAIHQQMELPSIEISTEESLARQDSPSAPA